MAMATARSDRDGECDGDRDRRSPERQRPHAKRLSAGTEAGEHGLDAVEKVVADLHVAGVDVAPGDSDTESRARLRAGSRGGAESGDSVAAGTSVALGNVECDGAEGSSQLVGQVSIVVTDAVDHVAKLFDGLNGNLENVERVGGGSCLHATPSDRTVTAPRVTADEVGAGAVLSRSRMQARPTARRVCVRGRIRLRHRVSSSEVAIEVAHPSRNRSRNRSRSSQSLIAVARRSRSSQSPVVVAHRSRPS